MHDHPWPYATLILKGGYGGFGNEHFKSSVNTTPKESREGGEGEKGNFKIESIPFDIRDLINIESTLLHHSILYKMYNFLNQ